MILSFGILIGFHALGSIASVLLVPMIPGNVIGMVLLTIALATRLVRQHQVEPAADLLVDNLAFLFVPAGVGVMSYAGVIAREWLPLSLSVLVSLIVVLVVTGRTAQLVSRIAEGRRRRSDPVGGREVARDD